MAEPTVTALPPAPLHVMEIWSDPAAVAGRIATELGRALPAMGRSAACGELVLLRVEPTVWLVEGDPAPLIEHLGGDGAVTPIGGGIVRVRLGGAGWRTLLMEGGLFDAEDPAFAPGCVAATVIEHVGLRLHVESEEACLAYVPASHAGSLIHFWTQALPLVAA